jgi:hypothetical protein
MISTSARGWLLLITFSRQVSWQDTPSAARTVFVRRV